MRSRVAAPFPIPHTLRFTRYLLAALRVETVGGGIMLAAAAVALIWANSPWASTYEALRAFSVGPEALHLHLDLATWAADGLLAVFFFVAGLEVKEEVVHGELRQPSKAVLPIVAAVAGMVVPAAVYLGVSAGVPGALGGWAIPTATDIAFALAVLAVTAPAMPPSLRAFLLTLAVVDDLGAITVIAIFYTDELHPLPLVAAVALLAVYAWLQRGRTRFSWLYYVPLALVVWGLVHASGIHATVAGVALGLLTRASTGPGEAESPAERADHLVRPVSAGVAVPLFALLAAGVTLSGPALANMATDRVALGVALGLLLGKFIGVFGGVWVSVRLGFATLSEGLRWRDLAALSILAGVGFTVSLLIAELAYAGTPRAEHVKVAILLGSFIASVVAAILLRVGTRDRSGTVRHSGGA